MNPSPDDQIRPRGAVMIASLGLTHLQRCPVEPILPIYLIVLGATTLLSLSMTYIMTNREGARVPTCAPSASPSCTSSVSAGSIWIYPIYPPNYTPGTAPYCHRVTYQFAFVITTIVWLATTLMFFFGCCFAVLTCCQIVISGGRLVPSRYSFYGATSDFQEPIVGDV
ncbi:hypothetical protein F7725_025194 [Dissostichus mawsoni]|uniref:Uncharacterized protein n=1 Tax=Dissostichus mawsoni TaxID=36200 RepID=A0A7J5XAG0_DISMA|nr:hypothetical protein F7725_025194 [Dissostichus mawsoni]